MARDRGAISSRRHRNSSPSPSPLSSSPSLDGSEEEEEQIFERLRKSSTNRSNSRKERSSKREDRKKRRRSSRRHRSERGDGKSSQKEKKSRRREREEEEEERRRRRRKRHRRRRDEDETDADSASASSLSSDLGGDSEHESSEPVEIVRLIIRRFPGVSGDLEQLLRMIDRGQGVDVEGIPDKALVQLLKKLFRSLNLKRNGNGVFLLPPTAVPTLHIVGSALPVGQQPPDEEHVKSNDDDVAAKSIQTDEQEVPIPGKRRLIGPEMPSRELLSAAAELTEADKLLREADMEADNDLLIGPPPPAMVAEAESANEAERFEEVSRIVGADVDKPYDVLGVNWKMSSDNIKKRYWKLSLMVHPDKCSHPQAHQAFVLLNQAFKDLQDPDKRKAIDEKIKLKEEEEEMKVELKALREAAQWRKLQGISIEGDDELLAIPKEAPKRDEWMTTLPPERKPGMTMQSTSFSRTTKEGRGDTSTWTDSPLDKAQKAKQNYLEAYNKAKALGEADDDRRRANSNAELVDKYNSSKRSVSLLQKHREESSRPKKKSKEPVKEEWEGSHPWKPWDREKDLSAGRKAVNFDSENMAQGLASRFSSGATQRNFL